MPRTLHLFTAQFPFGNKSETFLESEIHYLADAFERVVVYPMSADPHGNIRKLPETVSLDASFTKLKQRSPLRSLIVFFRVFLFLEVWVSELRDKGFRQLAGVKLFIPLVDLEFRRLQHLKKIGACNKNDIYYSYWFQNSLLALSIAKKKKLISTLVSRGHRYDIYDESWGSYGVPFRLYQISQCNALCSISEFGLMYLKDRIDSKLHQKLHVYRLGVPSRSIQFQKSSDTKLIVSCSSILDFKRVEKIPILLSHMDFNFKWIHYGDGPYRRRVEESASRYLSREKYELKGHVENSEVVDFYAETKVDLFISLSSSEGLPVSMMEAQSFGVPIVAMPVGGIPEIVIEGVTGFHFCNEIEKNIEVLRNAIKFDFDQQSIVQHHSSKFDSSKNYKAFTELLCSEV